ncbi:TPA: iron chaperone, partial [Staphylococcus pseudintermedius]|nr:iron chaperone [Staphylococcus pseudintermedius]
MNILDEFLQTIDKPEHREKLATVIQTILDRYPELTLEIKWNQ